jgi:hypothetical protein
MVAPLPPARLLEARDLGARLHPVDRALALLRIADPDNGEDLAALPIGERDRRLIALRRATFGDPLPCIVDCPACGEAQEFDLSAEALLAGVAPPSPPETFCFGPWTVRLRSLDSRDLAAAALTGDPERAAALLADRAIGAEGAASGAALPARVRAAAAARLAEREETTEIALALECAACGAAWASAFDIGAHFWAEIDFEARLLIGEVAALAARFGWAEADVLAMSPGRRQAYIEAGPAG